MIQKKRIVSFRTDGEKYKRIKKIADRATWTISQTVDILVGEALTDRQCREMIRKADGRNPQESAQEFLARENRRVERKRASDDEVMRLSGEPLE